MRRPESSIVLLMIVIAIILAVGLFLVGSILLDRSGTAVDTAVPEGIPPNTVQVEGETVTLVVDPNLRPVIIVEAPTLEPQPEIVSEQPTPQPEAQPAQPQPTAQPEAAPQVQGATGGQPADHVTFISYPVQASDTLYSIQRNNITSIALMAKHGIDAFDIVVGNVLNLPVGNPGACAPWRPYVVLQGDTAFSLSQRHGIALAELQARNNLDASYSIYETQVICVP